MDLAKVVVAEIVRTRGVQGEVVARSLTDIPGRLEQLQSANAQLADGSSVPVQISAAWPHKTGWILKFSGVDSIEQAERFRGADLRVPFANRGSLDEGEFFQSDLVGCQIFNTATGESVGTVTGWQQYGGPPLMEVQSGVRQLLIPFVTPLCDVDLTARTIRMEFVEGLLDL